MSNQWYSIVEYAREFSVSDMTVRRRIKTGKLHAVLREGKYYIPVTANEAERLRSSPPETDYDNVRDFREKAPTRAQPIINQDRYQRPRMDSSANIHFERPRERPAAPAPSPRIEKREVGRERRNQSTLRTTSRENNYEERDSLVPSHILERLDVYERSLVDTTALLEFCEHSLSMVNKMEVKIQEQCDSKVHALESELSSRSLELHQLQQQLEDLQVLVKILERRNG